MSRRAPAWKILGLIGLVLGLIAGAVALWMNAAASRRWMAMDAVGLKFLASGSLAEYLANQGLHDPFASPWLPMTRALYPGRLLMAEAFFFEWPLRLRQVDAASLPWSEAQTLQSGIHRDFIEAGRSPVHGSISREMSGVPRDFRLRRAQLRLLRAAARHGATGEIPDLDDPFGGKLLHRRSETRLGLWSVGPDGADDLGKGSEAWSWRSTYFELPSRDLVLEIPR